MTSPVLVTGGTGRLGRSVVALLVDAGVRAAVVVGLRPVGDNSAVAADDDGTGAFRGASFTGADFTGANFRDCDLRQVKIADSWLVDVSLAGRGVNLVRHH